MNKNQIINLIAPCGLNCGKCFAFVDGEIKHNSGLLKESLGEFEIYAKRFVNLLEEPVFKKYDDFMELLNYFANGKCSGCRTEECQLFKDCRVKICSAEKGVDFCYECNEFPCNNTGFDKHLNKRSVEINNRIESIGIDKYFEEIKDKPRY